MAIPATRSSQNNLGDVGSLLGNLANIFLGKQTTQTQQTQLTPEAMNRLIQQMMEGTSGLAAVSSGQRGAGLYNSSTNQLLVNDLLTRVSGEAALRGAPTTTTSTIAPQISPGMALGGLAGMKLLGSLFGGDGEEPSRKLKSALSFGGGDSNVASGSGGGVSASSGAGGFNTGIAPLDMILNGVSDAGSGTGNLVSSMFSSDGAAGANTVGSAYFAPSMAKTNMIPGLAPVDYSGAGMGGLSSMNLGGSTIGVPGVDAIDYNFAPVGDFANILGKPSTAGFDFGGEMSPSFGLDSIPWTAGLGSLAQGDLGGAIGDIGKSTVMGMWGSALAPVLGPFAPLVGILGGQLSVICTELKDQGRIPYAVYLDEGRYASRNISSITYRGYRFWADSAVRRMKKSPAFTNLVAKFAIPYIYDCVYKMGSEHSNSPNYWGRVVGWVGVPMCWTIGAVLTAVEGVKRHVS